MVKVKPLILHWHQDSSPVYSIAFQNPAEYQFMRFATAGGDHNIRIWNLRKDENQAPHIVYLSTLQAHERAVNTVEFCPKGKHLASAGDDGQVCIWMRLAEVKNNAFGSDLEDQESWKLIRKCRTASFGEIYDLSWSPDGRYLAACSMDKIVSILDTTDGTCFKALRDHKHYVQGVTWDPMGNYIATQSSDQRVIVYPVRSTDNGIAIDNPIARIDKTEVFNFLPESFPSFFRRLSFSLDGELLFIPSATLSESNQPCCLVYSKNNYKQPLAIIPVPKNSFAIKFNPVKFKMGGGSPMFPLGCRMVYAVATLQGISVYNTEQPEPICMISNIHYSSLTSLDWSPDGKMLLVTSIDGFCTLAEFEDAELGESLGVAEAVSEQENAITEPESITINTLQVRKKERKA